MSVMVGDKVYADIDDGRECGPVIYQLTVVERDADMFFVKGCGDDPVWGPQRWLFDRDEGKTWWLIVPKEKPIRSCEECSSLVEPDSNIDVCESCKSRRCAKLQDEQTRSRIRRARVAEIMALARKRICASHGKANWSN